MTGINMSPRYRPLKFIPTSKNFSEYDEYQVDDLATNDPNLSEDYELEQTLVGMLKSFPTDRYRLLFLLQILRHDGYKLPHESLYKDVLQVHKSWYFRMINRMKRYVDALNHNKP